MFEPLKFYCIKKYTKARFASMYKRPNYSFKFHIWGKVSSPEITSLCMFELTGIPKIKRLIFLQVSMYFMEMTEYCKDNVLKDTVKHTKQ